MEQPFGARIRDPNGTAFRGPNRGPNQTTFRGPNPGPERNSFSGPESGPESNNFSWPGALGCGCFSRGSLEATVSICTFVSTSHLFGARMVYDFSGPESGTRMEQLFGARIGARIERLFGPGLLAVDVSPGVLCASWTFCLLGI